MLSQFTLILPPPRLVPSVHDVMVICPTPGVSLVKSVADATSPDIGGPLNPGGMELLEPLALTLGSSAIVNEARESAVKRATRKIMLLDMFFTERFSLENPMQIF